MAQDNPQPSEDYAPQTVTEPPETAGFDTLDQGNEPTPEQATEVEKLRVRMDRNMQLVRNTFRHGPGAQLLNEVWMPYLINYPSMDGVKSATESALIEGRKNFIRDILEIIKHE